MAVNDVAVHKGGVARVIRVNVFIQGENVGPYSADGLIVATPTGSTAYSLSAGGPIVVPGVEAIIVTPIAAHTLAVRPLVVPATYRIVIEPIAGWSDDLLVSFDGQTGTTLAPGESVEVCRADHRVCLIRLGGDGFFSRMRQKLHWGDLSGRKTEGRATNAHRTSRPRSRHHRRCKPPAGPGLNVLTGETGAGKSMLVDALSLLLGERAAGGQRAPGRGQSRGRGRVRGDRSGHPSPASKSWAWTWRTAGWWFAARSPPKDVPVPGSTEAPRPRRCSRELGAMLVDLHGQHETQSLLHPEAQRKILDAFAHAEADTDRGGRDG